MFAFILVFGLKCTFSFCTLDFPNSLSMFFEKLEILVTPSIINSSNVVEVRKLRRSASAHDVIENEDQSSTTQHDKMKGGVFVQIRKSSSPKQSMYAAVTTKNPTSHPLGYHSLKKTSKKTSNLRDYQTQGGGTLPRNMGKKSRRPLFIDNIQKNPSLSRASHSFRETGSPKPSR